MAKKKTAETAKIEAVPVLRALGDDSTPEKPVITKSYIMRDDWIDKGVVNTVAFKSVDGEVQDLLVNGEPAGGGGASIASASVVVTNNYRAYAQVKYITASNNRLIAASSNMTTGMTTTYNSIAVVGEAAVFSTEDARTISVVSGSAQKIAQNKAVITGDCSLAIS